MNLAQTYDRMTRYWSQDNREAHRNPWFLAWIALVVVFLGVNALFVLLAVYSNPGLVTEDYYEKGREYEQNAIKLHTARNSLDWTTRLEIPRTIVVGVEDDFRFSAVDRSGLPITNADVQLHAYRPSDANADFVTPMQRIADGLYQNRLRFDLPGVWDVTVRVNLGDLVWQQNRRIRVLQP